MIGLIAGSGALPQILVDHWSYTQEPFCVVTLTHQLRVPPSIFSYHASLGLVGSILTFLKDNKVKELVLAGGIERPSLQDLKLDKGGLKWIKDLGIAWMKGDDSLLKEVITLLQKEGFLLTSPHDCLPKLLTPKGCLTKKKPTTMDEIEIGLSVLEVLSPFDVGQAVIVSGCRVLGIEGADGTESLITRCKGGILIKAAKKNQTLLVDLPSIGPETILQAKHLEGIALRAYGSQILEREKVIALCNQENIFLVGV